MRVAIITRITSPDYSGAYEDFIRETFGRIAVSCPEHQFVFISDRPFGEGYTDSFNSTTKTTGPASTMPLLLKYWYDIKIPGLLRKLQTDLLVCTDGFGSLGTRLPQCLLIQDLAYLQEPAVFSPAQKIFRKRQTEKSIAKAVSVIVPSAFLRQEMINRFGTDPRKIEVIPPFASEVFHPLSEEEKREIKEHYTEGREYFLYSGPLHTEKKWLNLLKAFSVFKKRQQSNLKLVLAGKAMGDRQLAASLATYKYRSDVVTIAAEETERAKLTGAAYACVYPSPKESFTLPVLEAMQCRVPVIVPADSALEEAAGQAGLVAEAEKHEDLAEKMMRLYKDEKLRRELIEKGTEASRQYKPGITADLLWRAIQKARLLQSKGVS